MSLYATTYRIGSRQLGLLPSASLSQACRTLATSSAHSLDAKVQAEQPSNTEVPPTKSELESISTSKDSSSRRVPKAIRRQQDPVRPIRKRNAQLDAAELPFEQHPYQCFQEARRYLADDRAAKLLQVENQKARIAEVEGQEKTPSRDASLYKMRRHLHRLIILADINDPVIKKKFEDGQADMNKPIYRHLADQKWRAYERKLIMQRLTTMNVLPDLFPHLEPRVQVSLSFRQRPIQPGAFVPSIISEVLPALKIQAYDRGPRYVTIGVFDPDVPDLDSDSFSPRCHFLATNITIDPSNPAVKLSGLDKAQHVVFDWLPPYSQKGSPYHRLVTVVYEHQGRLDPFFAAGESQSQSQTASSEAVSGAGTAVGSASEAVMGKKMDVDAMRARLADGRAWTALSLSSKFAMRPVGAHIFRATWDEWTAGVMQRNGFEGADVELKRTRGEKSPVKKRDTARYRGHRS